MQNFKHKYAHAIFYLLHRKWFAWWISSLNVFTFLNSILFNLIAFFMIYSDAQEGTVPCNTPNSSQILPKLARSRATRLQVPGTILNSTPSVSSIADLISCTTKTIRDLDLLGECNSLIRFKQSDSTTKETVGKIQTLKSRNGLSRLSIWACIG
jgi:hypothetical protein